MDRQYSKEEMQRIFAAAAEKQRADHAKVETRLTLAELEEAAAAAGIDPAYVREAAADLMRSGHAPLHRKFLGLPVEMRQSVTLPHALSEAAWIRIVQEARRAYKTSGLASDLGPIREWTSGVDPKRMPVRIVSEPEGDGTRISIERKTWQRALGVSIATAISLAYTIVFFVLWAVGTGPGLWIPAVLLGLFSMLFGGGMALGFQTLAKKDTERFRAILDQVKTAPEVRHTDAVRSSERIDLPADQDETETAIRPGRVRSKS